MSSQKLLHDNVAQFFAKFQEKHAANMACREGCSRCCHTDISVFASEASEIVEWFRAQDEARQSAMREQWNHPQANGPDAAGKIQAPCVFLTNNVCTIYEARPTICRSQGLPLMFRDVNPKTKEITVHVDSCPLNFTAKDSFPPQAEWLDLDRLNTLQSLASQQPSATYAELKPHCDKNNRISLQKIKKIFLKQP